MSTHPSQFDNGAHDDVLCFYCPRFADGEMTVPPTLHPDQRVHVCQGCYDMVEDVLADIEGLLYWYLWFAEDGQLIIVLPESEHTELYEDGDDE